MSISKQASAAQETSNKQKPSGKPIKSTSLSSTTPSKPSAQDLPPAASPKPVAAEELQARIKAARRSKTASHPLPEAVRSKLDHSSGLIHPALRARSGVTPNPARTLNHKRKSREDLSIDAVIRRLQTVPNGSDPLSTSCKSLRREHSQLAESIPPVPALPALPTSLSHRPRPYQTHSRRSSMTVRKSPLSNVSSPDDSAAESSAHSSRRTSASSRTSKFDDYKDEDDEQVEMVRVVSLRAPERTNEPESVPRIAPSVPNPKPQRGKSRSSWHSFSRKSILCSV